MISDRHDGSTAIGDDPQASAGTTALPVRPLEAPLPLDRYYSMIRGQIEHEDNLISTRLNWFITSQSFLFTAYAITAGNIQQVGPTTSHERLESLLYLIPLVAFAISAVICFGITAGVLAMRTLRRQYQAYVDAVVALPLPPVQGYRITRVLGISAPLILPVMFLVVWLFLLVKGFRL